MVDVIGIKPVCRQTSSVGKDYSQIYFFDLILTRLILLPKFDRKSISYPFLISAIRNGEIGTLNSMLIPIFENMHPEKLSGSREVFSIKMEKELILSYFLQREVRADLYSPELSLISSPPALLLINDGQNLEEMKFLSFLDEVVAGEKIAPVIAVGIHAGVERKMEYGIASQPDYMGRGAKAGNYTAFILKELLPFIYRKYPGLAFSEKAFAGFSLGGLMAIDIVWNHPDEFSKAGVFSGSFWWRSVDQDADNYDDDKHRILQQEIRNSEYKPGLKFFFQCGNQDETRDRNNNGIIDSVDDTLDIINELVKKGYDAQKDIYFMEMKEGKHDIATWAKAMPEFLIWAWGKSK